MKTNIYLIIFLFFLVSCHKKSFEHIHIIKNGSNVNKINPNCQNIDLNDCYKIFDCYSDKLVSTSTESFNIYGKIDSIEILKVMECMAYVYNDSNDSVTITKANEILGRCYLQHVEKKKKAKPVRLYNGDVDSKYSFYKTLIEWNSKESFEIGLRFLEYTQIDCGGHSYGCKNRRFDFFNYVLLPKLSQSSQKMLLNDEYFKIFEAMGSNYTLEGVEKSDKIFEKYLKWFNEKWQDGTLTLKENED